MGIENMRRWPMYIVFAVCILLVLSLLNSWSLETELRDKISELSTQLHDCSKQQKTCMEESLSMLEQRDNYRTKIEQLDKQKAKLAENLTEYKKKFMNSETQVNITREDVEFCKTELQSLKNLQLSEKAVLNALRLDKDRLTTQLTDKKQRIEELEKEVEKLKSALTTKSALNPSIPSKVTPAAQPPKLSSALNANNPINEPVLENDAKEEIEDTNAINDGNDFDPQLQ